MSPILANVYLHEVIDVWFETVVKPRMRERAFMVRYADDAVLVFASETDAHRVLRVLSKRFEKYGLKLHPEKTRLVEFRRPPSGGGTGRQPGTFDLLGFTHFWTKSRKGRWVVKRKTAATRFRGAVRRVAEWCRRYRHQPIKAQHAALRRKLLGHYAYYGITGNARALVCFLHAVERVWRKWLDRRSQRARMNWDKYRRLLQRYPLPPARVVHSIYAR